MKYFIKVGLVLLVFLAVIGCSGRDFESEVMKGYFEGPKIKINSPIRDSLNGGIVDLDVDISDESGIAQINVWINGNNYGYSIEVDAKGEKNYNLKHTIFAAIESGEYRPKYMDINIQAWDMSGKEAYETVSFRVDYEPFDLAVNIPPSWQDWYWTNSASLHTSGTTTNTNANVTNVFVRIREDYGQDGTIVYLGISNWNTTIILNENQKNEMDFVAIDDSGAIAMQRRTVIVDTIAPTVQFVSPIDNSSVPKRVNCVVEYGDNEIEYVGGNYVNISWSTNAPWDWQGNVMDISHNQKGFMVPFNTTGVTETIYVYACDMAGNSSTTQSIQVQVDGTIPSVIIHTPLNYTATNATSFTVYGDAEVEGGFIDKIEISINGGAYQEITNSTGANWVNWHTTVNLNNNAHNTVQARATSGTKSSESLVFTYIVDNTPPVVKTCYINNMDENNRVLNTEACDWNIEMEDHLSGLGNINVDYHTNSVWYGNDYYNFCGDGHRWLSFGTNFPLGGDIMIAFTIYDRAGNMTAYTKSFEMYPAIFVDGWMGNNDNKGFAASPLQTIQEGINKANSYGLYEVRIHQGTYNINQSIILVDNINLRGGYYNNFQSPQDSWNYYNRAVINGNHSIDHILQGDGLNYVMIEGLNILNGGRGTGITEQGGGIWLSNCQSVHLYNMGIESNQAKYGAGIYAMGSSLWLCETKITFNKGAVVSGAYFENSTITHDWGCSYGTNTIDNSIGADTNGKVLYAKNCPTLIVSNVVFERNLDGPMMGILASIWIEGGNGSTVAIGGCSFNYENEGGPVAVTPYNIYLNGAPGFFAIENNIFSPFTAMGTVGIYEAVPINGHIFRDNTFNNSFDFAEIYHDSVYGGTNDDVALNDPGWTGAIESVNNITN